MLIIQRIFYHIRPIEDFMVIVQFAVYDSQFINYGPVLESDI